MNKLVGPWTYQMSKQHAVIHCRAHEAEGQQLRVTNFIEIQTSPGIDAVKIAARLLALLQQSEEAPDQL